MELREHEVFTKMVNMTTRTTCRLCDSKNIALATKFADMPRADGYTQNATDMQALYPCELFACEDCGHAQIVNVVNPDSLFRKYLYKSGDFPYVVEAFKAFADETYERFRLQTVVEIGSNDGTMLGFFKERGARVFGIDPSDVPSPHTTFRKYFTSGLANSLIYGDDLQADLMLAFNSFAHCDDLMDYVEGVRALLAPGGVFVFEASYLTDIVPGQFDKFDHEHLSYHSVGPLIPFFERHGLELFDVTRNPSKGGSIRGYVQHKGGKHPKTSAVHIMPVREEADGFRRLTPYKAMTEEMERIKERVHGFMKANPGEYAGFGASSSSTPLIYDLGLQDKLAFLVDDNPLRHGLYSPGAHIPVYEPWRMANADYVLMLAWRYAKQIMASHWVNGKWVKVI